MTDYSQKFKIVGLQVSLFVAVLWSQAASAQADVQFYEQHYDGVLGTSLDISIYSPEENTTVAESIEATVQEIARLEQIFSTYRDDSEVIQLNNNRRDDAASAELIEVLNYCQNWYENSAGKFSCRLAQVLSSWTDAEARQIVPERPDIRALARKANQAEIVIEPEQSLVALGDAISIDPSGLAKGYIIDKALALLRAELPNATAIKVDIGGDAAYWGNPTSEQAWQVAIANPLATADNAGFIGSLALNSMAVAASGHNSRTRTIGHREFSHILTPRDGWPVENGLAAIVIAKEAVTADAIATALSVQSMVEAIDWVNSLDDVEALVVASDGRQMTSANWLNYSGSQQIIQEASTLNFTLEYTLPEFNVASYNRPYVAIWVTDTSQKALKNLLLLGETQRWARENTRWWRRVGRRNPQLLDGVARSTRGSGEYSLQWNGLDDFGEVVPPGEYILHLEASRENGGSSYQRIDFSLGAEDSSQSMEVAGELGTIELKISN